MKLSRQLATLIAFAAIGLIILSSLALYTLRTNLVESRKHEITSVLTLAKEQVAYYIDLEKQGVLSHEEAEARVVEALSTMRKGTSYIWANGGDATSKVHPIAENIGTFQPTYAPAIKALKNTEFAFSVGQYPKPGTEDIVTKVNGMTQIPDWNWVIGIGVYMDDLNETFWKVGIAFTIAGSIILSLIIVVAVFIARAILKNIGGEPNYVAMVTNRIADGNLNETIQGNFGEQSLLGSIARMQTSLKSMVKDIHKGSALLTNSTKALNEQMQSISLASKKSSDASHSTAAAIQELSSCIEEIANSARDTESNSEESSEMTSRGEALVKQSSQSINEISNQVARSTDEIASLQKRSLQIGNIVNVIQEIAEQTNLLALNAAIEAARAGEQGRGFAVVADEVRTLASRTATATSEITETINLVQSDTENVAKTMEAVLPNVEESVESSNQVSAMLSNIRASSDETLVRIRAVSHSAVEQNTATQTLAEHVEEISSMVQGTAEAVVLSKQNTDNLDKLALELHNSVSYFKV